MTAVPATVDSELQALDALDRMYIDNVRHLPVVDAQGQLVGLVSSRDIAKVGESEIEKTLVAETMTEAPYSCTKDTPLSEVAFEMENKKLGSTIVTEGGKPVGIFTTTDALLAVRSLIAGEHVEAANPPRHLLTDEEKEDGQRTHVRKSAPRSAKMGWALFPGTR
jgi:acetoin utilization protein AcuB